MHVGQGGKPEHQRLGGAGQSRQRSGEHESQQLVAIHVVAQRQRARFVLADRLQHLAEGRMDDAVDQPEAGEEHREHHVVDDVLGLAGRGAQLQQSEQLARAARLAGRPRRR